MCEKLTFPWYVDVRIRTSLFHSDCIIDRETETEVKTETERRDTEIKRIRIKIERRTKIRIGEE